MLINTIWITTGNIAFATSLWFILVLLTKSYSADEVGNYALAFAVCAPVFMLSNMRLRLVQTSDALDDFRPYDYIGLRITTSSLALLVIIIISYFSSLEKSVIYMIIAIGIAKYFESISDMLYGFFQKYELMKYVGMSLILKSICSVLLITLAIFYEMEVLYVALLLITGWALPLVIYDIRNYCGILNIKAESLIKYLSKIETKVILDLIKKTYLLSFVAFLSSLLPNIPKYMIFYYQGNEELGIYAAIIYFSTASALIAASLGTPYIPKLANSYAGGTRHLFISYIKRLFIIAIILGVLGIAIAKSLGVFILEVFYTELYSNNANILVLCMFTAALNHIVLFQIYALTVIKKYKTQMIMLVTAVSVLLMLCYIWIPDYGMEGAIYAEMCSAAIQASVFGIVIYFWIKRWKEIPEEFART
jgi:O-antigen/teichoic acid export membrane protein